MCTKNNKTAVKLSYYRNFFNTEFNLIFHKFHTDTCTKCDSFHNLIRLNIRKMQNSCSPVQPNLSYIYQMEAEKVVQCKKLDIETHKSYISNIF